MDIATFAVSVLAAPACGQPGNPCVVVQSSDGRGGLELTSIIVSGLALLLAGWVYLRQRQLEGRATFVADWVDSQTLIVLNLGPGAARNVTITPPGVIREERTIENLPVRHPVRLFVVNAVSQPLGDLTVTWRDNRSRRQGVVLPISDPPSSSGVPSDGIEKVVRSLARSEAKQEIENQFRGF